MISPFLNPFTYSILLKQVLILNPRIYIVGKNIDLIPGCGLNARGIVVLPQGEEIYILCNATRKSVVRMRFLTQCKLVILSLGVKRLCAKLSTYPM
jgi:hypothetical protein